MKVLADTSIWIDHFRRGDRNLSQLLDRGEVVVHPFVIGELLIGHVPKISEMLDDFNTIPKAMVASNDEVVTFIVKRKLAGRGIGYVDAHLLAAATLAPETLVWTRDKRLLATAQALALAVDIRE